MRPLLYFGLLAIAAGGACATEGDVDQETTREDDAGSDSGEIADASDVTDGGVEASRCSTSGLCRVEVGIDTRINVTSISGSSAKDVWAVGSKRTVLHYDGNAWETTTIPGDSSAYTMRAVWLASESDVWVADGPTIRHSTGWKGPNATTWESVALTRGISAISGAGGTVAIAVQQGNELTTACSGWADGGLLDPVGVVTYQAFVPHFIAVTGPNELWGTSYQGTSYQLFSNRVLRASRDTNDGGTTSWTVEEHDSRFGKTLYGVWGNERVIWLVGEGGAVRRMTRERVPTRVFEQIATPVTSVLLGVYGFGDNDMWAVGDDATVIHWDGKEMSKLATPFDRAKEKPRLLAVWGSSPDDIWIGGNGVMLHYERKAP